MVDESQSDRVFHWIHCWLLLFQREEQLPQWKKPERSNKTELTSVFKWQQKLKWWRNSSVYRLQLFQTISFSFPWKMRNFIWIITIIIIVTAALTLFNKYELWVFSVEMISTPKRNQRALFFFCSHRILCFTVRKFQSCRSVNEAFPCRNHETQTHDWAQRKWPNADRSFGEWKLNKLCASRVKNVEETVTQSLKTQWKQSGGGGGVWEQQDGHEGDDGEGLRLLLVSCVRN